MYVLVFDFWNLCFRMVPNFLSKIGEIGNQVLSGWISDRCVVVFLEMKSSNYPATRVGYN